MNDTVVLAIGLTAIFAALTVGVTLLARGSAGPTGVARSLATIEQLRREHAVARQEQPFSERVVGPFFGGLVGLASRLSPAKAAESMQRRLDLAGNPGRWTPERLLAYKGLGLVVGLAVGFLFGVRSGPLGLLLWMGLLGAGLFFLPDLLLYNAALKRQDQIRKTLPDALDLLTISVEAGLGFDAALVQVARNTTGPLAGEFFRVLQEMQIGKGRSAAFQALGERTTVDELKVFVSALVQADRLGIPVANVLREQAREMRVKRRQRAEEAAAKVPVKILFPLVFCIFPALFIVIIGPGVIQIVQAFTEGGL